MELKERIIQETQKLMCRLGPSAMTMDMVARNCGISKRTLYEQFPDKKSLIRECLYVSHAHRDAEYKKIFETSANCFEALFKVFNQVHHFLNSVTLTFHDEIRRQYPDIYNDTQEETYHFIDGLSLVLTEAQGQGLVVDKIDTKTAAFLFISSINNIHRSEQIEEIGLSKIRVFEAAFINFLRGIATIKGIDMIDDFLEKNKK